MKVAKDIWDTQGPHAWSVYSSGAYKKYLPAAMSSIQVDPNTGQSLQALDGGFVGRGRVRGASRKLAIRCWDYLGFCLAVLKGG